jgi:hypothetical protein
MEVFVPEDGLNIYSLLYHLQSIRRHVTDVKNTE